MDSPHRQCNDQTRTVVLGRTSKSPPKTKRQTFARFANSAADFSTIAPTARLGSGANRCRLRRRNTFVLAIGLLLRRLTTLANVDATLEERSVFNGDASRDDVTGERPIAPDINAVAGRQIAADFAEHHDFAGINIGSNHAIAPDGNAVTRQADRTFDPAVDVE